MIIPNEEIVKLLKTKPGFQPRLLAVTDQVTQQGHHIQDANWSALMAEFSDMPTTGQMVVNVAKAASRAVQARGKKVPESEINRRMGVCRSNECGFFTTVKGRPRCKHKKCGCHLRKKAALVSEDCPVGAWSPKPLSQGDLANYFDKVYVVSLARRPERFAEFMEQLPANWPFKAPEKFDAIDGKEIPAPAWWKGGRGAWGCYRSHMLIMEDAMKQKYQRILVLEDDCQFIPGFAKKVAGYLATAPSDWGQMYLGGQHLKVNLGQLIPNNNDWYTPYNVNRTHAYALQGDYLQTMYKHCNAREWGTHHIDHHMGRLHMQQDGRVIVPREWLAAQRENHSDISGMKHQARMWKPAGALETQDIVADPFIAVAGLHSAGTSCVAGLLWHLEQYHLGNELTGFYGNQPGKECGYEAAGLHQMCSEVSPGWVVGRAVADGRAYHLLRGWINGRKQEARVKGQLAAGKHPLLCSMPNQLLNAAGPNLKLVVVDRPLGDSITSLQRRQPKADPDLLAAHQTWLAEGKEQLAAARPHIRIDYYELLQRPEDVVQQLIDFLGVDVTPEQKAQAVDSVNPSKRHV